MGVARFNVSPKGSGPFVSVELPRLRPGPRNTDPETPRGKLFWRFGYDGLYIFSQFGDPGIEHLFP